jgi:hypothetical protein
MPRVGVLWHAASAEAEEEYLGALTKAFHELGYFEGKNIDLEHRFPAEQPERSARTRSDAPGGRPASGMSNFLFTPHIQNNYGLRIMPM